MCRFFAFFFTAVSLLTIACGGLSGVPGGTGHDNRAPSVPAGITQTYATSESVTLAWTPSTDPDTDDVIVYRVYLYDPVAGSYSQVGAVTTPQCTVTGLSYGNTYLLTVRAKDEHGLFSGYSEQFPGIPSIGVVDKPAFSVPGGAYNNDQVVAITTVMAETTIYYTTDGSIPGPDDTLYTGPVTITTTTTLKAVAYRADYQTSLVKSAIYTMRAGNPVCAPAGEIYTNDLAGVTLSTTTTGASIRYTIDGSNPTSVVGTLYAGPFPLASTATIRAIAYRAGYEESGITSEVYTFQAAAPVMDPAPGYYTTAAAVTITTGSLDATIHYTIDGSDPTELHGEVYAGPVSIPATATVKAIAFRSGYMTSGITSGEFRITGIVDPPQFDQAAGTYNNDLTVTITAATGAAIRYTTDDAVVLSRDTGIPYTTPVPITETATLRAIAYKARWQPTSDSDAFEATYTLRPVPPTFSSPTGTYTAELGITMSTVTPGAQIRYNACTPDMTPCPDPTAASGTLYAPGTVLPVASTTTIRAIAYKIPYDDSAVSSAVYTYTALTPGNGGAISLIQVTPDSIRIGWQRATDDTTLPEDMQYRILCNGVEAKSWTADLSWEGGATSWELVGLSPNTSYTLNVEVRDEDATVAPYTAVTQLTDPATELPFKGVNGAVRAIVRNGTRTYIGGDFTRVSVVPFGAMLDASGGANQGGVIPATINGAVWAAAPDGSGGWYIGGDFTEVNGVARSRIARILADGSLHAWNPNANGRVRALLVENGMVYAGGAFTGIGGETRNRIAKLDGNGHAVATWNPDAGGPVLAFALSGSWLYAAGSFSTIGGEPYLRLARIGTSSGDPDPAWRPRANSTVYTIAVAGTNVYAGGSFTTINDLDYPHLARLNTVGGEPDAGWNPSVEIDVAGHPEYDASTTVYSIVVSGSTVYAGGYFNKIDAVTRNNLAAIDASGVLDATWDPNIGSAVMSIALNGASLYAGGAFTTVNGVAGTYLAAIDADVAGTGARIAAWDPMANGLVNVVSCTAGGIFAGGSFTGAGGVTRNHIAAFNDNGIPVAGWDPNLTGSVRALAVFGSRLYAGGEFTRVGGPTGTTYERLAAFDLASGAVYAGFNPGADQKVNALAADAAAVYAGGAFTMIGTAAHESIVALDPGTGAPLWSAGRNATGAVHALATNGTILYAGGNFTQLVDATCSYLVGLDVTNGTVAAGFTPAADAPVKALDLEGTVLYAGGTFKNIGGKARNRVAALAAGSGVASDWNPDVHIYDADPAAPDLDADTTVNALFVFGSTVYLGGYFDRIGTAVRGNLAAIDASSGIANGWDPPANGAVNAIALNADGTMAYIGGAFLTVAGMDRPQFAGIYTSGANSGDPR